jgi:hypothetical protein
MILNYEKDLKTSKNIEKLNKLYGEKDNFKTKKISSELKKEILNNSFS